MSAIDQNMQVISLTATVRGSRGAHYQIKRTGDGAWSCTCPAWRYQDRPGNNRTCKHVTSLAMNLGQHVVGALR